MKIIKMFLATMIAMAMITPVFSQVSNWQNGDLQQDSVFGISTEKAYKELLKGKKPKLVVVGIVDSGVDTLHEDLKPVIWTDSKGSGHGINFLYGESGQEDITKLVTHKYDLYDSLSRTVAYAPMPKEYVSPYKNNRVWLKQWQDKVNAMVGLVNELERVQTACDKIISKMGKNNPTPEELQNYRPVDDNERAIKERILKRRHLYATWDEYRQNEITNILEMARFHLLHGLNFDNKEKYLGKVNEDVSPDKMGPVKRPNTTAYHGTHVAGIIGATRNNNIGMNGVADNVQLLMLKENGNIHEMRDDCLARAIIFAVDKGAKVINLSFGKPYTWNKKFVDSAVEYAMKKDVLIVHAAGNEGKNIDSTEHYPNPVYANGLGTARAWLEVGASGKKDDDKLVADFSNYGARSVDVFAPGVQVYSTLPFNQYDSWDGTSMATPVVAGLAALIREYYPKLTAVQVKDIIMKTVVKRDVLKDKCVSGGVVNAYNALKLAATYK